MHRIIPTSVVILFACNGTSGVGVLTQQVATDNNSDGDVRLSAGANVLGGTQINALGGVNSGRPHVRAYADPAGSIIVGLRLGLDFIGSNNPDTIPVDVAGSGGQEVTISNVDPALPVIIANQSTAGGADASDWIIAPSGRDVVLLPGQSVVLVVNPSQCDQPDPATPVTCTYHGWSIREDTAVHGVRGESTTARAIGVAWQPGSSRPTLVVASMSATCVATVDGGQAGRVDLAVGTANPPTRVVGSVSCSNLATLAGDPGCVGCGGPDASTQSSGGSVTYMVKPGDWVEAIPSSTIGHPSYTLSVTEETL